MEDFVCGIEWDDKNKRFKSVRNSDSKNRNLTNSLIECVSFPIVQNYNDRYDRIFLKVMRIMLLLISNNLFSIRLASFQYLFKTLSQCHKTARNAQTKTFCRNLLAKLFEVMIQRIALENFFFNSNNPIAFFYTETTKQHVSNEVKNTLTKLRDMSCFMFRALRITAVWRAARATI